MQKLLFLVFFYALQINPCIAQKQYFDVPVTDFFHLCFNVDSAEFTAFQNNSFLKKEFSSVFVDTAEVAGKPSIELFLLGQETFLHINQTKGYWKDKMGGGALVFQSRFPDKIDSLRMAWNQFYKDSFYYKTVNSGGNEVNELAIFKKRDSLAPVLPSFYTVLLSFSRGSYHNWGYADSVIDKGIDMKRFMHDWDKSVANKLFKKITAAHIQVTPEELGDLKTVMKTLGYSPRGKSFRHVLHPVIYYSVNKSIRLPKYTRIEIELSKPVQENTIAVGRNYILKMKGTRLDIISVAHKD